MLDGVCWEQMIVEPTIEERDCGYWPTLKATSRLAHREKPCPSHIKGTHGWSLNAAVTDNLSEKPYRMWPTPTTVEHINPKRKIFMRGKSYRIKSNQGVEGGAKLCEIIEQQVFPTPTKRDYKGMSGSLFREKYGKVKNLADAVLVKGGGQLNPNWVEWLMGWPIGWTDLKPLEMDKFQQWLEQFGRY